MEHWKCVVGYLSVFWRLIFPPSLFLSHSYHWNDIMGKSLPKINKNEVWFRGKTHLEEGIELDKWNYESKNYVLQTGFLPVILLGSPMSTVSIMVILVVVIYYPSELLVVWNAPAWGWQYHFYSKYPPSLHLNPPPYDTNNFPYVTMGILL